jgi:uncharacterized protein YndB with AHSA1/START domain
MTETGEFTYRRVHRGSRELLFDCLTTPEHLTHVWGPAGTTTPIGNISVDLRPGGIFETTMVNDADGGTYTMRAVYVEVHRPDRLVRIEADVEGGMRTTITFVDLLDGRTEMVTHLKNPGLCRMFVRCMRPPDPVSVAGCSPTRQTFEPLGPTT